jgi:hypothetical protein
MITTWISVVSGVVTLAGSVTFVLYFRKSLRSDAEAHAKGKKIADHLSTFGDHLGD